MRMNEDGATRQVARDVACVMLPIVNVYLVGEPGAGDRGWVLVDAGLPGTAGVIARAAAERFGPDARPATIVLTHGHFDHVSALKELAERWDAPVYAHPLELPYLTGQSPYPPPDPTVGGGAITRLSPLFPRDPIDLGGRVHPLPADGSVPGMPGWRTIYTPGHSPGHVSLWRESDSTLIAGDAFTTTKQGSAIASLTKPQAVHGPPAYFTPDWAAAEQSVRALAALRPTVVATGHGFPMSGPAMQEALAALARDFARIAWPAHGRYANAPAITDARGVVSVPPPPADSFPLLLGAAAVAAIALATRRRELRSGFRAR